MAEQTPRVDVLTIGTFDTPHIGHARLFKFCETLGRVIVGVNSDDFVKKYKKKKPLFDYHERIALIAGMGYEVWMNDTAGRDLITSVQPKFLVIGSDWLEKDYLKQIDMTPKLLELYNITLVYTPYTDGISSTEIKKRVSNSNSN